MANSHLRTRKALKLDRALSGGMGRQIIVFLLIVVISFLLLFGIAILLRIPLVSKDLPEDGFGSFWTMLFFFYNGGLEWTVSGNRWFAYFVNIVGSILMGGILIATITNYLLSNREKAENGLLRYRLVNHTVFIGIHESMFPLIREVINNKGYAAILSERPFLEVKEMIIPRLGCSDTSHLIFYHGQRTDREDLKSLCLNDAKEVFIFPEPLFSDTDSTNLDVVELISSVYARKDGTKLKCTTIFQQDAVVSCFERSDINAEIKQKLDFTPLVYGNIISLALLSGSVYGNTFLDREPLTPDSRKRVHLYIIGLGEIGRSLFVQAVRQLHFPNYELAKSSITLVGKQTDIDEMKSRYREFFEVNDSDRFSYLGDFLDISVQVIPLGFNQDIDTSINNSVANSNELVTVAICLEETDEAQKRAMSLPRSVYENSIPIWLYKPDSDSIARMIGKNSFYSNIVIFGEPDELFGKRNDVTIEDREIVRAQRVNWVYSVYTSTHAIPGCIPPEEEWNEVWVSKWNKLNVRNKWSNLNSAYSIPIKLRSLGIDIKESVLFTEEQVENMCRVEHNRWVADALLGGYRPPTQEEREMLVRDRTLKSVFKNEHLVHLDLCRYDDLLADASGIDVRDFDRAIVESIPLILQ